MSCWTKSGQNVYLEISLQVKITKNKLTRFYLNYGENWKAYFVRYVIKEVKDATTQFEVSQFFEERELISDTLQSAASAIIEQKSDGALQLMDFQFRKVEIDEDVRRFIITNNLPSLSKQSRVSWFQLWRKRKPVSKERFLNLRKMLVRYINRLLIILQCYMYIYIYIYYIVFRQRNKGQGTELLRRQKGSISMIYTSKKQF